MIKTKNNCVLSAVSFFSSTSITDVISIFRRQQRFFLLFLLTAAKSVLSRLTGKYFFAAFLSSVLSKLTAPGTLEFVFHCQQCCVADSYAITVVLTSSLWHVSLA